MFNFVGNLINVNNASYIADFFGVIFGAVGTVVGSVIRYLFALIWNVICKWVWTVCKWVLGVLDIMQLGFSRLIGIDLGTGTSLTADDYIDGLKHITVSGGSNYYDYILKIFRALAVVAIVLMIIFTIYAMIMQEYKISTTGYEKADNQKGKFVKRILINILTICLIPLIFYTIIVGTNSILTSFYRALGGYSNTTIAGNVLAVSTYDANRYRTYANANKRIPITIEVYSTENVYGNSLSDDEIKKQINDKETQGKLKAIAGAFAENSFLPFNQSTVYANGTWSNYSNYSLSYNNTVYDNLGQYFENFICTREQYYVLADFIDYCQLYNVNYYIKEISESDICWKYVENIQAERDEDGNALGDITLTVNYRDAETVNNPSGASAASVSSSDIYSLKFTTKLDLTSPISDALKTAATLLGINESTSKFNAMERDDSGDYVNLVTWSTRKVKLKFSKGEHFDIENPSSWNFSDQIIVYEYFRFQNDYASTNNTLEDYTLNDLKNGDVYLDVMEMTFRNYNSNTNSYSSEYTQYCTKINGNYYRVKESEEFFDDYGTAYFELDAVDTSVNYFEDVTVTIEKIGTANLKLSTSFDINNKSSWTFIDQVLVYEYFKDLSLSNGLRRTNKFSDFKTGVNFNVYQINNGDGTKKYVYINGTYYQLNSSGTSFETSGDFLQDSEAANIRYFGYQLGEVDKEKYGLNNLNNLFYSGTSLTASLVDETNAFYQKYASINMKLSEDFSFSNTDTWTFRDYAIMKIFIDKLAIEGSKYSIDMLKNFGLQGKIYYASSGAKYYLELTDGTNYHYLDLDVFDKISEEKITQTIASSQYHQIGLDLSSIGIETFYSSILETDKLLNSEIKSHAFYLSENFNAYEPSSWTIGDYILLYLNEEGVISGDIEHLKDDGYNALVYEVLGDTYYRFGKLDEDGGINENSIFLSESNITDLGVGYTVDNVFSSNLISFIINNSYGKKVSDLVYTESNFVGGLVENTGSFTYNVDDNFSSSKNLQNILAQDFLNKGDVITDKDALKYTYVNTAINTNDPTTWTIIDAIIFAKTGTLPDIDNPYETYLYSKDSKVYMMIDNAMICIMGSSNGTNCGYTDSNLLVTNQVYSNKNWLFSSEGELKTRYTNYFSNIVKSTITPAGSGVDFGYYSNSLKGSGTASYQADTTYSDMDVVLIQNGVSLTSNGYYVFESKVANDGTTYIKLKENCYIAVTDNEYSYIYYKENALAPEYSSAAIAFSSSADATYKSFDRVAGSQNYDVIDAVIYTVVGSETSVTYKKYTSSLDGKEYIIVNNKLLQLPESCVLPMDDVAEEEDEIARNEGYLSLVYSYYSNFITSTTPTIKKHYTTAPILETSAFEVEDMRTWSALRIIFYKNDVGFAGANCSIIQSVDGEFYLSLNGKNLYVNLTGLANVIIQNQVNGTIKVTVEETEQTKLRWRLASVKYDADAEESERYSFETAKYFTDINLAVGAAGPLYEDKTTVNFATGELVYTGNINNWTWAGLIKAYVDANNKYSVKSYYHNGKVYYAFYSLDSVYYVPEIINFLGGGSTTLKKKLYGNANANYDSLSYNNSVIVQSNSKLDKVLKKEGLSSTVVGYTTLFKMNAGVSVSFYVSTKTVGEETTKHAIYNLSSAGTVDSAIVRYVTINTTAAADGSPIYSFEVTNDETKAKMFSVDVQGRSGFLNWSMFDLVFAYATNYTLKTHISSYIYVTDYDTASPKYYVKYDEKYILIPTLDSASLASWLQGVSSSSGIIKTDEKVFEKAKKGDIFFKLSENSAIETSLTNYVSVKVRTDSSADNKVQKLEFSSGFDYSDYSTWTISDYIIYYAFENGFYDTGSSTFSYEFPFTYIPQFSNRGDLYYKLSYLDIVMCDIFGTTNYLTSTDAYYEFMLVYNADNKFYLKLSGGGELIPLSEKITLDFTKMTISSTDMGENFTVDTIENKLDEYQADGVNLFETDIGSYTTYNSVYSSKNFQTFVNTHGAPVYVYYILKENSTTGSVEVDKVINFASENGKAKSGTYYKYDMFYDFYGRKLSSYLVTESVYSLDVEISSSGTFNNITPDFKYKTVYSKLHPDLEFDNYYYYNVDISKLENAGILNFAGGADAIDENIANKLEAIKNGTTTMDKATLNLKLSSVFNGNNIKNPSEWTILDFIVIYEYSREGIRHNKFQDITLKELNDNNFYVTFYIDRSGDPTIQDDYYLYINYNFYKLNDIIKLNDEGTEYVAKTDKIVGVAGSTGDITKVNGVSVAGVVSSGAWVDSYGIRVKNGTFNLSINPDYSGAQTYNRDKNNISFTVDDVTYFKYIDTNVADTNYRINTANYGIYTVKTLIKTVSWVEKLMNDMQVYYPDLNWGVLLATDGWLDTLGEFTSAYTTGLYTGDGNSSNTTAAGLVLSEFFMSVATEVDSSYANYEYSSVFDEDTLKALMLSLMGEENYNALVLEVEVFMDYFNSCFAPIIDDFAAEFGESIGENSLRLNAYKSYLATLLLSSDIGEYLYTIATRVYAEYTIGEYLANAAGDYASYYGYVNSLKDEEGNEINSYEFGTFAELIIYENEYCGNSNPTFSFNFKKAFEKYADYNETTGKYTLNGLTLSEIQGNTIIYKSAIETIVKNMKKDYELIYKDGYMISEFGEVVDEYGNVANSYKNETHIYCYMIHVLYSIKNEINGSEPTYLKCYEQYIDGDIARWNIIKGENIDDADQYIESYNSDKGKLVLYQGLTAATIMRSFMPSVTLGGNEDGGFWSKMLGVWDSYKNFVTGNISELVTDNISKPLVDAYRMVKGTSIEKDIDFFRKNAFSVIVRMGNTSSTTEAIASFINEITPIDLTAETSWEIINEFYDSVDRIVSELIEVRQLLPGEGTEKGSTRAGYSDSVIDAAINAFEDIKYNLNQYISAQNRIDLVQKRSITFTLAQYGSNYVSTGYKFSVRNKEYTFKSSTDPVRLAEYVYGGAFLESVGVGAQYTSSDFTGIVKASKVYDNVDKVLKTNLDSWSELRNFASEIADKTAELYFLTNLGDLDISKENAIKIDDNIGLAGTTSGKIEEALYNQIKGSLSNEIVARITNSYNSDGTIDTSKLGYSQKNFIAISKYLFRNDITDEDLKGITLEQYKRYAINELIENDQNSSESPEERAARYMVLYNLTSVQVDLVAGGQSVGRVLKNSEVNRTETTVEYKGATANYTFSATFSNSSSTLESIKTLSGLENRPTREVLTRQYSGTRTTDYYDEAYGDTFIACTYKNGLYYPILATGSKNCDDTLYQDYLNDGILTSKFVTNYYYNDASVVVMKGVITADGYPTAIRKYNNPIEVKSKKLLKETTTTYNAVTYYRTNVGANMSGGDDLVDVSRAVGRVTTKNYTKYVYGTSFTKGIGGTTTYTGRTNLRTIVKSDYKAYFAQVKNEYLITQADDYGAISVLDEFSYYYVFSGLTWLMLMLAFITIIPLMINAIGGAATRIFDLIVLFLASPVVISTNSLYDGKNKIYDGWKKNIQSTLLGVFGYIIGFSSFTILVPMVYNTSSFVSYETYEKVQSISGIGSFFSYPTVNSLMRYLWVVTAVTLIVKLPKIFLPIITANNGDLKSPEPSLDGSGKPFLDKTKEFANDVNKKIDKLGSVVSGRALVGLVANAKDEMTSLIPGYGLVKGAKNLIDGRKGKKHDKQIEAEQKLIETKLAEAGFGKDVAKTAAKALKDAEDKRKKDKEKHKKFVEDAKSNFQKTFM